MKQGFKYFILSCLVVLFAFGAFEGELLLAETTTTNSTSTVDFIVSLEVTSEITLTCEDTKDLGTISGLTGGNASSTVDCNVVTNNSTGYLMWVKSSTTPAMRNTGDTSEHFNDYATGQTLNWSNAANTSTFGFSVSSTEAVVAFQNNGAACGVAGTSTVSNCWRGFAGQTNIQVNDRSTETAAAGVTTTFGFQAEVGGSMITPQPTGVYNATVEVTAAVQ